MGDDTGGMPNVSETLGVVSEVVMEDGGKYYFNADRVKAYYIQKPEEVDKLYAVGTIPKLSDLVDTCLQDGYSLSIEDSVRNLVYSDEQKNYIPNLYHKGILSNPNSFQFTIALSRGLGRIPWGRHELES